ncbi:hypothetical protein HPG69_018086 [Diceros bicornis minor]|uniref:Uncharacterized protein n=1 Tax=Diceros bicornis minor TaxID=77932 RepID=A0A7J7F7U9_DICBM|nr:hypothetical protein HPG69_018086 [Diceros bicornis minor]
MLNSWPVQHLPPLGSTERTLALSAILFLAVLIGLLLLWGHPSSRGHLPSGHWPLSFLGNILYLDHQGSLKSFQALESENLPPQLQEKNRDVFMIYLRLWPGVIPCGCEAVREAPVYQAEAFSG